MYRKEVSRKDVSSDESGDDDHEEKQQSKEDCSEFSVDSIHTEQATQVKAVSQQVYVNKVVTKFNLRMPSEFLKSFLA